ncbi:cytochrome P450 [Kribbella sp. NPDC050820]|uniref:cytochrome P450 n=1 Tax=Kribbella sp. NPDC050820 TaxID=3155408 RepID=UPI00340FDFA4
MSTPLTAIGALFQPMSAGFIADPYEFYARLPGPLVKDGSLQWIASGHEAVDTLLRHRGLRGDWPLEFQQLRVGPGPTSEFIADIVLHREGTDHAVFRGLLGGVLRGLDVELVAAECRRMVDELLDEAFGYGEIDLVERLAVRVPVEISCLLFGIPRSESAPIAEWGMTALNAFTTVLAESEQASTDAAIVQLTEYLERVTAAPSYQFRTESDTALARLPGAGRRELIHNLLFLLISGFTTSVHFLSSMLGELAVRPDLWSLLRTRPELIGTAIDELVRYTSPIQHVSRLAVERIELDGQVIRPGRVVHLLLAAANRDRTVFDRQNELDLTRRPNPHVAFGRGLHACLGGQLGRLEAMAVLGHLVQRVDRIELANYPVRTARQVFRGFERVPVVLWPGG